MTKGKGILSINVAKAQRFCDRKIPTHARDQLLWEVATRGRSITIYERRPPWLRLMRPRNCPDEATLGHR